MVEEKHSLEQRDSVVCFVISQLRRTRWPHNYDHTHTHITRIPAAVLDSELELK